MNFLDRFSEHRRVASALAATVKVPDTPGTPTVLCISKMQFTKDIEQLRRHTNVRWAILQSKALSEAQYRWVPERERLQTIFSVRDTPEVREARAHCEKFAEKLIEEILEREKIDAILSCNMDYWQDHGLRVVSQKYGIPFLVLCREHDIVPDFVEEKLQINQELHFRFPGEGIAIFGDITLRTLVDGGYCEREKITITGAPRLDEWRDKAPWVGEPNRLTFLSYANANYMAPENCREALRVFAEVSRGPAGERCQFFIKCKNEKDLGKVEAVLAEVPGHRCAAQIDFPMIELLQGSRWAIGFNSLALLEALLCGARLAVPAWGDAARPANELMIDPANPKVAPAFDFMESPEALAAALENVAAETPTLPDMRVRRDVFREYFHYPEEGTSCDAVVQFIEQHVAAPTPGK